MVFRTLADAGMQKTHACGTRYFPVLEIGEVRKQEIPIDSNFPLALQCLRSAEEEGSGS
jgi:hypothetical protein